MDKALRIKEIRRKLRMSQGEFADYIGCGISSVWRWEHGDEPSGPAKTLILKLGHELLNGTDTQRSNEDGDV